MIKGITKLISIHTNNFKFIKLREFGSHHDSCEKLTSKDKIAKFSKVGHNMENRSSCT